MMDLLSDAGIWLTFSFIIFMVILVRMGKQTFINMLDGRIESVREEIQMAENLRVEAQELLAQYQRKHRDAVKDAEDIISNAEKRAAEITKAAEQDLADTSKRREKQLKDRLDRLEQSAIAEIQTYAAELAIKATTEIIANQLDKKSNEKLVEQAIKDLPQNIH